MPVTFNRPELPDVQFASTPRLPFAVCWKLPAKLEVPLPILKVPELANVELTFEPVTVTPPAIVPVLVMLKAPPLTVPRIPNCVPLSVPPLTMVVVPVPAVTSRTVAACK